MSAVKTDNLWIELNQYGFLEVAGAKAGEFLQGQLTCNVPDAAGGTAIAGAYCSPKGRVISQFMLAGLAPDRFLLRMRSDLVESTAAVLHKYGVFSRVKIEDVSSGWKAFGLLGQANAPEAEAEDAVVVGIGDGIREIWSTAPAAAELEAQLDSNFNKGDADDWNRTMIQHRRAEICAATSDQFLPNMLGYTDDGTVHFRKGCYTGQEIIARTHYRGSVKRQLSLVSGQGLPPAAGNELMAGQKTIGSLVNTAAADTGWVGLAVIAETSPEGAQPTLADGREVATSTD